MVFSVSSHLFKKDNLKEKTKSLKILSIITLADKGSLIVTDDLGNVDVNINMEINNWYQTPHQIEFSTYYTIDMTSGDTITGIMMNMMMQMNIQMNGITDVFSVTLDK